MKKLLKAVALATVMCMLLSTAAFANTDVCEEKPESDQITIGAYATAGEQVVLLIVDADVKELSEVTESQIQFIDQVEADSNGYADFGTITVKDEDPTVDVYIGYAGAKPKNIGDNINLAGATGIVIADVADPIIEAYAVNGSDRGYAAAITVNVPESLEISRMIWGFTVNDSRRYSKVQTVSSHGHGNVTFAAAFDLGTVEQYLKVSNVSAIFFTGSPDSVASKNDPANTHYTNADLDARWKKDSTENVEE